MEGRISREDLLRPSHSASESAGRSAGVSRGYDASSNRSSGASRGYGGGSYRSSFRSGGGYKKRYSKRDAISDGKDLFIVQMLASGVLLLIVMFMAVVDTGATNAAAEKLGGALSDNATFTELKDGVLIARNKLKGGADAVLEIFGGELDESVGSVDSLSDDSSQNESAETGNKGSGAQPDSSAAIKDSGVSIDSETLTELYDAIEDYPKN